MSKNKLPLSIVIPCAYDTKIKDCIDSIDEKVEVIVALNGPTKEVENIVDGLNVKKIKISERNLAKALNTGIENAKYEKVLFIDSDCTFKEGAIKKIFEGIQGYLVANGKVVFEKKGFVSLVIARCREYVYYNPPKPYNPFLCIDKKLKKKVGGYYFDESIGWTEDADLYVRIKKEQIPVNHVLDAEVLHEPLSFRYDLRSAFRYGSGRKIRVAKGKAKGANTHFNRVVDLILKKGTFAGIYYIFWNFSYLLGYLLQTKNDSNYFVKN